MLTNLEQINIFCVSTKETLFYERPISIKQLWLEIIQKIGCSKWVRPSTVIFIIFITRTDFEHHFSQSFRVSVVLSRWTFYKKCFFCWDTKKISYIQNWWTIPLKTVTMTTLKICYLCQKQSKASYFHILTLVQIKPSTQHSR